MTLTWSIQIHLALIILLHSIHFPRIDLSWLMKWSSTQLWTKWMLFIVPTLLVLRLIFLPNTINSVMQIITKCPTVLKQKRNRQAPFLTAKSTAHPLCKFSQCQWLTIRTTATEWNRTSIPKTSTTTLVSKLWLNGLLWCTQSKWTTKTLSFKTCWTSISNSQILFLGQTHYNSNSRSSQLMLLILWINTSIRWFLQDWLAIQKISWLQIIEAMKMVYLEVLVLTHQEASLHWTKVKALWVLHHHTNLINEKH